MDTIFIGNQQLTVKEMIPYPSGVPNQPDNADAFSSHLIVVSDWAMMEKLYQTSEGRRGLEYYCLFNADGSEENRLTSRVYYRIVHGNAYRGIWGW